MVHDVRLPGELSVLGGNEAAQAARRKPTGGPEGWAVRGGGFSGLSSSLTLLLDNHFSICAKTGELENYRLLP